MAVKQLKKKPSSSSSRSLTASQSSAETHDLAPPPASTPKLQIVKPFLRGAAAAKAYYTDISELGGGVVNPRQARTVIEGLRKLCIQHLKEKAIFKLHGIANYKIHVAKARKGGTIAGPNVTWKAKEVPAGRKRVHCTVLKELEKDVIY